MANKPHTAPAKKKAPPAEQTSSAIEEQIAAFIAGAVCGLFAMFGLQSTE